MSGLDRIDRSRPFTLVAIVAFGVAGSPYASAAERHVPGEYATIQAAIDACSNGDEVVVAPGVYTGEGNRNLDFAHGLPAGQTRTITVRGDGGADTCVIDCEGAGRGFYFHSGETADAIVAGLTVRNGLAPEQGPYIAPASGGAICCLRAGPTITNCRIIGNRAGAYAGGGGIACCEFAAAKISGCLIADNVAAWGGGLYVSMSNATVTDCTITSNSATSSLGGGGIHCGGVCSFPSDGPTILRCRITYNTANTMGGGIACVVGSPVISNCLIAGNRIAQPSTYVMGGGVWYGPFRGPGGCAFGADYPGSRATRITNCVIIGNSANGRPYVGSSGKGGGVCGEGLVFVEGCTIVANVADAGAGVFVSVGWQSSLLVDSVVWGNTTGRPDPDVATTCRESSRQPLMVSFTATPGALPPGSYSGACGTSILWGDGNTSGNPLFVDSDGPDDNASTWEDNDYHLGYVSPAVNTGDPAFAPAAGETDMDGQPRVSYGCVDIGAYEYLWHGPIDFDFDADVDLTDFGFFAACFSGPNRLPPAVSFCLHADLDADADVDISDFLRFQACFNGPNRLPRCES